MPTLYNQYIYKDNEWKLVGLSKDTVTQSLLLSGNTLTLVGSDGSTSTATINTGELQNISVNGTVVTIEDGVADITVPTKTSDLTNDSGFITGQTETDPVFVASAAHGISSSDISNWNSKTSNTGTVTEVTAGTGLKIGTATSGGTISTSGTINHINSVTAQNTQAVYPIKIDAQGHISAYGTAVTSMPASDVSAWAKAATKPTQTASEVGAITSSDASSMIGNAISVHNDETAVICRLIVSNGTAQLKNSSMTDSIRIEFLRYDYLLKHKVIIAQMISDTATRSYTIANVNMTTSSTGTVDMFAADDDYVYYVQLTDSGSGLTGTYQEIPVGDTFIANITVGQNYTYSIDVSYADFVAAIADNKNVVVIETNSVSDYKAYTSNLEYDGGSQVDIYFPYYEGGMRIYSYTSSGLSYVGEVPFGGEQSNWNEHDTTSMAYILNKPDLHFASAAVDWGSTPLVIYPQTSNCTFTQSQTDKIEAETGLTVYPYVYTATSSLSTSSANQLSSYGLTLTIDGTDYHLANYTDPTNTETYYYGACLDQYTLSWAKTDFGIILQPNSTVFDVMIYSKTSVGTVTVKVIDKLLDAWIIPDIQLSNIIANRALQISPSYNSGTKIATLYNNVIDRNVYDLYIPNTIVSTESGSTTTTNYYPVWVNALTGGDPHTYNGLKLRQRTGTASTDGLAAIMLGNSTASGTAGNATGSVIMFGAGSYYVTLQPGTLTANRTITFPDKAGTVALTSDLPQIYDGTVT